MLFRQSFPHLISKIQNMILILLLLLLDKLTAKNMAITMITVVTLMTDSSSSCKCRRKNLTVRVQLYT